MEGSSNKDDREYKLQIVNVVSLTPNVQQNINVNKDNNNAEEKLLLKLIKNLVNVMDNDSENTVLTNLQLMEILQQEFGVNVQEKTEFEVEVYMNILKKFLKSWPRWDEFDKMIKDSKFDKTIKVNSLLQEEYNSLKSYLVDTIKVAEKHMPTYVEKLKRAENAQKLEEADRDDGKEVCMEVLCSDAQLRKLFFKVPHPRLNNTIFNIDEGASTSNISVHIYKLEEILNLPGVQVQINLPGIECFRKNTNTIKRTLMNMKIPENQRLKDKIHPLKREDVYSRCTHKRKLVFKEDARLFFKRLKESVHKCKFTESQKSNIAHVFEQFEKDFAVDLKVVYLGADYQVYLNDYKYVRRIVNEVPHFEGVSSEGIDPNKYDLQLEELLTPSGLFQLTKFPRRWNVERDDESVKQLRYIESFLHSPENNSKNVSWLRIECTPCEMKFENQSSMEELVQHYVNCHTPETDWHCTGCRGLYSASYLAQHRWAHHCKK